MPTTSSPLRVLIVEDELLIRWSIAETLAQSGHTVTEAPDGKTAVRVLTAEPDPPDVVLLDHRLPDSNDLALLATIKRLAPHSAVVMMTAHGASDIAPKALELGAQAVIAKPFDMHAIENVLAKAYVAQQLHTTP